ncbi:arginine decarboxylase [Tenacibaculum sp. Bg11-29]|uniref:DUF4266 domain-containing protein n=1 Tax=Tenacibaculum sp. Bg11-29 TaxID=2058306 RepID=UPI000C32C62B|nr:DUF4266 domain-containing protein [Tenacibaculum sp. Bg11-29]PKH51218.1 arginine decarboxylase [Tenacibaculum sp. Bg11-29]
MIKKTFMILLIAIIFSNCASVKPYQKMYLNDEDMALSSRKIEQYEISSQNYREGASGANGGKSGGGCGCN